MLGDYSKALEYWTKSLRMAKKINDFVGQAYSLNNIATIYDTLGDYPHALEYYKKSGLLFKKIGNCEGQAGALNNAGYIYRVLGDNKRALEYYTKSLIMRREIGDRRGQSYSLSNIGCVFRKLGYYSKALKYYTDSLKIQVEIVDRLGQAYSLNNIGYVHRVFGDHTEAIECYNKSLKIREEIGDRRGKAYNLNNIGSIYVENGKLIEAEQYLTYAKKIAEEISDKELLRKIAISFGEFALKTRTEHKVYRLARNINSYAELALKIAKELKSKSGKAEALLLQARILSSARFQYKDKGEPKTIVNKFTETIRIFKKLNQQFELAQSYFYYGRFLNEINKKDARLYFQKATKIFRRIGARHWLKKIKKSRGKEKLY
jgi:tetratricopeptide (TPR) repeat protein